MDGLKKAQLCKLRGDTNQPDGKPVDVQFNPTSLRLQMQNNTDKPKTQERQVQQYNGQASTTLSLDLVFDTADEGDTKKPVDVRSRTAIVTQFMIPAGKDQKPPRVRFQWGSLIVDGVMESYSEELDLFASSGEPLRAKVGISIKGQSPEFAKGQQGPGARSDSSSTLPGDPPPAAKKDSTGQSIEGETAADFAVRMGLDPSAWRGLSPSGDAGNKLAAGLPSLALPAGLPIDFSSALTATPGVGTTGGAAASMSLEAALAGGDTAAPPPGSAPLSLAAGAPSLPAAMAAATALTAAGGVASAIAAVTRNAAAAATAATAAAFGAGGAGAAGAGAGGGRSAGGLGGGSSGGLGGGGGGGGGLGGTIGGAAASAGAASVGAAIAGAASAGAASGGTAPSSARVESARTPLRVARDVPPPRAPIDDPRATTYGLGVPLRPRLGGALDESTSAARGEVVIGAPPRRAAASDPPWARRGPPPRTGRTPCGGSGRGPCGGAR